MLVSSNMNTEHIAAIDTNIYSRRVFLWNLNGFFPKIYRVSYWAIYRQSKERLLIGSNPLWRRVDDLWHCKKEIFFQGIRKLSTEWIFPKHNLWCRKWTNCPIINAVLNGIHRG
jgi:hypothetical protein